MGHNIQSLKYVGFVILIMGMKNVVSKGNFNASSGCKELLESFAYVSANFTYCAISNARPITLCKSCIQSYLLVKEVYSDILHLEDTGGELCKDQLSNLDRLQVVNSGFDYVANLWGRASCASCFENDHEPKLKPEVQDIWNASDHLNLCLEKYKNDTDPISYNPEVCKACLEAYESLNKKYNGLKAVTGDINFCMDIVDLMNSTRNSWSDVIGCCKDRRKPEKFFLISSGIIALYPFIFYIAAFTFSSKKEEKVALQKRLTLGYKKHFESTPSGSSS